MILSTKDSSACSQNRIRCFRFSYFLLVWTIISFSSYLSLFVTMRFFFVSINPCLFHRYKVIILKNTRNTASSCELNSNYFLFCRHKINKGFEISFISTSFFKIFRNGDLTFFDKTKLSTLNKIIFNIWIYFLQKLMSYVSDSHDVRRFNSFNWSRFSEVIFLDMG